MFGVIIPNQLAQVPVAVNQTTYTLPIANGHLVTDICVSAVAPFPADDVGAAVFYSAIPPYNEFAYLGALSNSCLSTILRTGWDLLLAELPTKDVLLKIEILPAAQILELVAVQPPDVKLEYGKKVALNLYRYLESYNTGVDGSVLQKALDNWLIRFEAKSKHDPNFVFKTE
ncbi:putative DUF775 domain protein [Gregarina niphandrodes]|uniref:DUF775 domain protein n=1 Tax=Gregarina niphandrodes TaxID=110365 RepID=A0A023B5P5_GRENI|nr:putative DUF775 domain protein [Gregarina niphandrodes]EZG61537.1 putative DUF775 domain protein [Gregarina niphandrodes]|eukprot:XP_011130743.1 putative DUF775 domain protein [Gregarina niphandrodes]